MFRRPREIPATQPVEDAARLVLGGGTETTRVFEDKEPKVHTLLQRIGSSTLARHHVSYAGPYGLSKKQRAAQVGAMQQAYLDALTDEDNLLASQHSVFVERVAQHPESGEQALAKIMGGPNYPESAIGAVASLTYLVVAAETVWPTDG